MQLVITVRFSNLVTWGSYLIFAGRFIQGLWTGGQQTIEQGYVAEAVDKKDNLSMISDIGSAAVLGFVLGPLFGLLGTQMTFELGPIYVDQYNACGYLQCIFTIIMIIATIFFFTEIP